LPGAIYLMRHGETAWNRERRFQGRLDSPLTERGIAQARRMGETLARVVADRGAVTIVASPLGRARATAATLCPALGASPERIETDARLTEIDVGVWAGLTYAEIAARWPDSITPASRRDWFFRSPDGETYDAIAARARSFLDDAALRGTLVVVAHGITSRLLRGLYLGLSRSELLRLELSQDAVFRLADGTVERIACAAG
jgi:broad specificity phosphatase PhoE